MNFGGLTAPHNALQHIVHRGNKFHEDYNNIENHTVCN